MSECRGLTEAGCNEGALGCTGGLGNGHNAPVLEAVPKADKIASNRCP